VAIDEKQKWTARLYAWQQHLVAALPKDTFAAQPPL
jgi:hypothetical protein